MGRSLQDKTSHNKNNDYDSKKTSIAIKILNGYEILIQ